MAASENNSCLLFVYFSLNLFEIRLNSLLVWSSLRKFRYVEMPPYPGRKTELSHSRPFPRNPMFTCTVVRPFGIVAKGIKTAVVWPFTLINVWKNQALKGLKKIQLWVCMQLACVLLSLSIWRTNFLARKPYFTNNQMASICTRARLSDHGQCSANKQQVLYP